MTLDFLQNSIGGKIQMGRGGPEKITGELVNVGSDYLTVRTGNEVDAKGKPVPWANSVVYVASNHVKSIVLPTVTEVRVTAQSADASATEQQSPASAAIPVLEAETFMGILTQMQNQLVQVNHGGPNASRGLLIGIGPDYMTIVHEMKETIHYPLYHVQSISRIYHVVQEDSQAGDGNDAGKGGDAKNSDSGNNGNSGKNDNQDKNKDNKKDDSSKNDKQDKNKDSKKDDKKDDRKDDKKSDRHDNDDHGDDRHSKKRDKR